MKRSEQLNSKIAKLEEQLKEAKKEARKLERIEKQKAESLAYEQKVREALSLIELSKTIQITVNNDVITIYDYLKRCEKGS